MKKMIFWFLPVFMAFFHVCFNACAINSPAPDNKPSPVYVSSVTVLEDDFILETGRTRELHVDIEPAEADQGLEFLSTNPEIAGVDNAGVVTAYAPGETSIIVTAADGSGVSDTVSVTVIRAMPDDDPLILWDWRGGDGYESGKEVRGKTAVTLEGEVALSGAGNLVLKNGGRFTIGTADTVPTSSTYMPADGALDFSKKTKIEITYTTGTGTFSVYMNNNTTSPGNSVLGSASRLYNRSPLGGKIQIIHDPLNMNNAPSLEKAFLQFAAGDSSTITISGITVSHEDVPQIDPEDLLVQNISIIGGNFSLSVGQSKQLQYLVLPETALNKQLSWSTANGAVASVSSGYVQALGPGTAQITAAARDGTNISASVTVTVTGTSGDSPQEEAALIFNALKGRAVVTGGWADQYNDSSGVQYTNPANYTLIDDGAYPSASAKLAAFRSALADTAASFIIVSGDIDLSDGKVTDSDHSYYDQFNSTTHRRINGDITADITSDTTIIGINNARIKYGGLRINNKTNVIIRNVTFYDAHGSTEYDTSVMEYADSKASIDALVIQGSSDGVWVDHCTFTDGVCEDLSRNFNHDGAFDIPKGKNITVSWCEFTNHDKVMLVASSDSAANAVPEDRRITLHHNYFHDKVTQRMPRARGTQMHIYNNYYNNIGVPNNNGYSLGPGYGSQFIVENNYFGAHTALGGIGIIKYFDPSENSSSGTFSRFYQSGNIPLLGNENCSYDGVDKLKDFSAHLSAAKPWTIPYPYTPDPAAGLVSAIPAKAGSGLQTQEIAE